MSTLQRLLLSPGAPPTVVFDEKAASSETDCSYCGCTIGKSPSALDGAKAAACILCGLVQNLVRPRIDDEACLVWIPELSQSAINVVIRRVHLLLRAHSESVEIEVKPTKVVGIIPSLYHVTQALRDRRREAEARLGTSAPSELGDALLRLAPDAHEERGKLLCGTRLLPLGRVYRGAENIYPQILDSWTVSRRPVGDPC
jgi:hypothetical protein